MNKNRPKYIKHKLTNVINVSKIVTMFYHQFDKNFHFNGESHDFWEFVYVDSGTVHITASKKKYILKKGDFIFHKPNEFHAISADKKTPANVFVVSFVSTSTNMAYFKNKISIYGRKFSFNVEVLFLKYAILADVETNETTKTFAEVFLSADIA